MLGDRSNNIPPGPQRLLNTRSIQPGAANDVDPFVLCALSGRGVHVIVPDNKPEDGEPHVRTTPSRKETTRDGLRETRFPLFNKCSQAVFGTDAPSMLAFVPSRVCVRASNYALSMTCLPHTGRKVSWSSLFATSTSIYWSENQSQSPGETLEK